MEVLISAINGFWKIFLWQSATDKSRDSIEKKNIEPVSN